VLELVVIEITGGLGLV